MIKFIKTTKYDFNFVWIYYNYLMETNKLNIPFLAHSLPNDIEIYKIVKDSKIIGFYIGKYINNDTYLILQFYIFPEYRYYYAQIISELFRKYPKLVTNVRGKLKKLYEKHKLAERID